MSQVIAKTFVPPAASIKDTFTEAYVPKVASSWVYGTFHQNNPLYINMVRHGSVDASAPQANQGQSVSYNFFIFRFGPKQQRLEKKKN